MKIATLMLLLSVMGAGNAYATNDPSTKVKAAILFKITRFVQWPKVKIHDGALDLCVTGDHSLYKALKTTEGQQSKGLKIRVPQATLTNSHYGDCELLFIGSENGAPVQEQINTLARQQLLLVSDLPEFAKKGGMIQLRERGGRFRFIINLKASKDAGLDISSQLLGLAKVIK